MNPDNDDLRQRGDMVRPLRRPSEMPPPKRPLSRKLLIGLCLLLLVGVLELCLVGWKLLQSDKTTTHQTVAVQTFNKQRYTINQADSLWVVVNKGRELPSTYVPAGLEAPDVALRTSATDPEMHLRPDAAAALQKMFKASAASGVKMRLASGYRSYDEQAAVYAQEVKNFGVATAESESAHPGHSEHQTGLAADLEPYDRSCEVADCFTNTPAYKWLSANSYKYGFIIRYPKSKENITGYKYEPWHVRYVGLDLAKQLHKTGQTMEEFFGLPSFTDYPTNPYQLKL